ncbi:MAG: NAD-dependent epimerase/dehydratase family protein [Bacteroidales bacterium]
MVLITGGTGFLGSHLIHFLLEKGVHVRALKRDDSSFAVLERVFRFYGKTFDDHKQRVEWVNADITDYYSLEDCLANVDQIYHAAACVSFQPGDNERMQKINTQGTANLVNLAVEKKIAKFCHVSSIAAIGRAENDNIIDENVIWKSSRNNSNYAISKYGAEREVWRGIEEGLNAVIVNPSIILGPGEINSGSARLIKTVEKGLKFYTPGINGFVDVRDVVEIMVRLMDSEITSERFVVSSENLDYQTLFRYIANEINKPEPLYKAGKFLGGVAWRAEYIKSLITRQKPLITKETSHTANNMYRYSSEKIQRALRFTFRPVKQSIHDACDFYLTNS